MIDLEDINSRIIDRSKCFYWQTDRNVSLEEIAFIWKDRHFAIKNDVLLEIINSELKSDRLAYIEPFDEKAQTSYGSTNSIRVGRMESGKKILIRCHPRGVKNGYFETESLASEIAIKNGLPGYGTYLTHPLTDLQDISFQVIELLDGALVNFYLKDHPEQESTIVYNMGKVMAKLHKIKVYGFGPFNNNEAKKGNLIGLHSSLKDAVNASLDENLDTLVLYKVITPEISMNMKRIFMETKLLDFTEPVLIHNDFADWNALTDGEKITGIIDWDECIGGHPVEEIACWSTFFDPERINQFLKGYFSESKKPDNFEELFQLFKLRYTISKMALRTRRYAYEQSELVSNLIDKGKKHLDELLKFYNLIGKDGERD